MRLRTFLLATMALESPATISVALTYELVSISAAAADSPDEVYDLLREIIAAAVLQVREFGVGHPHP